MQYRRVHTYFFYSIVFSLVITLLFIVSNTPLAANTATQAELQALESQIRERGDRLSEIEKEIAEFAEALQVVGAERSTLENAIRQLELERSKVQAEIRRTQNQIDTASLTINKLQTQIAETENSLQSIREGLADSIRTIHQSNDDSLITILLKNERLTDFWEDLETRQTIQNSMTAKALELNSLRESLLEHQNSTEQQKNTLLSLQNQYNDQNTVLSNNRAEQAQLLSATRNEESSYQELLAERRAAREQIVREVREFESRLQFILDPNTIPQPGTTVFDWPLENIRITQLFGGTEFAARNASVYGGRAYHPGVDFGAPRGTPIYAPLAGVVRATGNTDAVPGCLSWGKWILVDHPNGLATLYAHLDVISSTAGQRVNRGDIIGYTGNTGFSTGPHLHFTVYVAEAVTVRQFNEIRSSTSCGAATTPIAAIEAYLDPMLYLPPHPAQPR